MVDTQIEDGRALIAELIRDGFDVAVAFWVRADDDGPWLLYIGSRVVRAAMLGGAYSRVYASLNRIHDVGISLSQIKLVPESSPSAQAAVAVRDRHPASIPTRYHGKRLGDLSIEEAYIYPSARGQMLPDEVLQTVLQLMNRSGPLQASVVTLRDGSIIRAIPNSIAAPTSGTVQIGMIDVATGATRLVNANDVVNIQ